MADLKVKINDVFNMKSKNEWQGFSTNEEYELIGLEDFSTPNGSVDFKKDEVKLVTGILAEILLRDYPDKVELRQTRIENEKIDSMIQEKVNNALKNVAKNKLAQDLEKEKSELNKTKTGSKNKD
ncbi:MAG: hypothetical protein EOL97_09640 [Spirochaetia bacterium]|nr:hypothetical protein [Spirochaetia bacterium]